jgi:hypothetical protein
MLTLLSMLLESPPERSQTIREAFFHLPTLFDLVDFVLTVGIIFVLWRYRRRVFKLAEGDAVAPRQYERLTARLDAFERTIAEDRVHRDARFDEIDEKLVRRAADDQDFRRAVLECENTQTRTMQKMESGIEAMRRELGFVRKTMERVPCVLENGTTGRPDECPPEESL